MPTRREIMECYKCGEEGRICTFCSLKQGEKVLAEADPELVARLRRVIKGLCWQHRHNPGVGAAMYRIEAVLKERGQSNGNAR